MYERLYASSFGRQGLVCGPKTADVRPGPSALTAGPRTGILGFTHVLGDDGKTALVEFIAKDRSAFNAILADKTVKSFLKGRDKR